MQLRWLFVACAAAVACEREPQRQPAPPPAPVAAPVPLPKSDASLISDGGGPEVGLAAAPAEDTGAGDWVETPSYKFKLEGLKRCGGSDGGASAWLGFTVQIATKVEEIFISPRDVTLERAGVVLAASYLDVKPLPNCSPLLPQRQLRAGQSARGVVLFEVPPSFAAASAPIKLAYRPTRWGGAPRVQVNIQSCLDTCSEPTAAKARGATKPRKPR